jgi:GxxExxY protein
MREPPNGNLIDKDLTDQILNAAVEVHTVLGPGYLESIYQNALTAELKRRGLSIEEQKEITVTFKGAEVGKHRLDIVVESKVVLELKAVTAFDDIHTAQIISYLKATGFRVGLLLNFAKETLKIKRVVL